MPCPELKLNTPIYSVLASSSRKGEYAVSLSSLVVDVAPYEHINNSGVLYAMFSINNELISRKNIPMEHCLSDLHQPMSEGAKAFGNRLFSDIVSAEAYLHLIQDENRKLAESEFSLFKMGESINSGDFQIGDILYEVTVQTSASIKATIRKNKVLGNVHYGHDNHSKFIDVLKFNGIEDNGFVTSISLSDRAMDGNKPYNLHRCFFTLGAAEMYKAHIDGGLYTQKENNILVSLRTIVLGGGSLDFGSFPFVNVQNTIKLTCTHHKDIPRLMYVEPKINIKGNWPRKDRWGRI
jgi:hypothetical protein